ncbi:MAG: putative lipid II flippase FtsW [Clostridia bacterium]|nr:putative lipid II flippase FtsW [Clostridia bacterium]MDE7328334.1 putative lipid II flippase FtsW [Clostridia bacterium]
MGSKFSIRSKTLIFCAIVLSLIGLIMQYSASCYSAQMQFGDAFYYVKKQAIAFVFAIIVLYALKFIKTEWLKKFRYVILGISLVLLALVFVPKIGVENYGAKRWLNLGITTMQPSDVAKFALVIFIASCLDKKSMLTFKNMIPVLVATCLVCVLIMLEPNMSVTMCVGLVVIIMLFVGGCKAKHFLIMAIPVVAAVVGLIFLEPYRVKRLMAFIDPWASPLGEGYQLIQSYYALGSGGLFGLGLFNSRQKYLFLTFSESDFILSVIGEELGWVGATAVLLIFIVLIACGIKIAMRAENRFDCYLAAGITAVIAVQTLLNIAVVSGSIPPTGIPLPFISNGGTSLVCFMAGVGILENIACKSQRGYLNHKMY